MNDTVEMLDFEETLLTDVVVIVNVVRLVLQSGL